MGTNRFQGNMYAKQIFIPRLGWLLFCKLTMLCKIAKTLFTVLSVAIINESIHFPYRSYYFIPSIANALPRRLSQRPRRYPLSSWLDRRLTAGSPGQRIRVLSWQPTRKRSIHPSCDMPHLRMQQRRGRCLPTNHSIGSHPTQRSMCSASDVRDPSDHWP